MKKFRALSCFVIALCLVFYAVPRLPFNGISELASGFSIIWLAFAMLVIGSNLSYVVGTDKSGPARRQRKEFFSADDKRLLPDGGSRRMPSVFKRNN